MTAVPSLCSQHCISVILSFLSFNYVSTHPYSSLLLHTPSSDPERFQTAGLSLCVTAMCVELIWTLIKSQLVHMGRKHNHSLSPQLSLSPVGRTLISNPFIHALTEPTPQQRLWLIFKRKTQNCCQTFNSITDCI